MRISSMREVMRRREWWEKKTGGMNKATALFLVVVFVFGCFVALRWRRLNYCWTQPLCSVISRWTKSCHPEKPQSEQRGHFPGGRTWAGCVLDSSFRGFQLWVSVQANSGALCLTDGKLRLEELKECVQSPCLCLYVSWGFRREFVCMCGAEVF